MTCAKCAFRTPSLAELIDHAAANHPEITTAASRARYRIEWLREPPESLAQAGRLPGAAGNE